MYQPKTPIDAFIAPMMVYAPIVVFFVVFITAFLVQIVSRIWSWRQAITAAVIAFFFASIPLVLPSIREGTRFESHAGPEEIPREIRIERRLVSSVSVAWRTDASQRGAVRVYEAVERNTSRTIIANAGKTATEHQAIISDLKVGKKYEIEILSGKTWYNDNGTRLSFSF